MTHAEVEFLRQQLLAKCEGEHALTMHVIDALPEDKVTWKPDHEKCMTAGELAAHSVTGASFFVCQVTGKHPTDAPPPPPTTKADVVSRVTQAADAYMTALSEMPIEELAADLDFGGASYTAIDVMSWHPWHMVHHRGQLQLYLRLMGAVVPATYGPSGDTPHPDS